MRIGILGSNFIKIPPDPKNLPQGRSGASEKVMYLITEELVKKGHQVVLFASGNSMTSAQLVAVADKSSSEDPEIGIKNHPEMEHLLISKCYQMAKTGKFDIIHSIFDIKSAYYAPLVSTPTVSTLHSPIEGIKKIILEKIKNSQYYVSISNYQRVQLPDLNYIQTIYHGINPTHFPFYLNNNNQYLLFAGRITQKKGVVNCLNLAKRLKKNLYILGTHYPEEQIFWENEIKPFIDGINVCHKEFLGHQELVSYYQKAKIFLFPIQWEEPFGLVMIEAMACGTPVVAYARGSVPEVVKDGETGFIVNPSDDDIRGSWIVKKTGFEGLCEAVERIYSMPEKQYLEMRHACRAHVERNFTVERMVDEYEKVYQQIVSSHQKR